MLGGVCCALFLACGILQVRWLLPRHRVLDRVWLGLSLGLLEMMWLPALWAFACTFGMTAHFLALGTAALLTGGAYFLRDKRPLRAWDAEETRQLVQALCFVLPLTVLSGYLQYTHVMRVTDSGAWNVGQSTYGDLPMHLSFITGLKNASFPADYPFYPGARLSYPFLTDSLSTSFYLMGCSLQAAAILPATLMMALCFLGVLLLGRKLTAGKKTILLAACLFFLNGGLGFLYDFDLAGGVGDSGSLTVWERIQAILTGYYKTPTNQPDPNNLRWSNVICDLMIPQRTLLGGWCMVLPCFYLLWCAFDPREREELGGPRAVSLLGVWAGALPLIHTHSFLALGLCTAGMLLYDFAHSTRRKGAVTRYLLWLAAALIMVVLDLFLTLPGWYSLDAGAQRVVLLRYAVLAGLLVGLAVWDLMQSWEAVWPTLRRYLLFGGITLLLAAPQLLCFTFAQALSGEGNSFLTLQFNWVNNPGGTGLRDMYLWFYVKNIGLPVVLLLCALAERDPKHRRLAAGAFMIFLAAELVRFQPNEYDNNKLFYLWYLLCTMIVSDWCAKVWRCLKGLRGRWVLAAFTAVCLFLSAGLTIWRECVSDYQAFSSEAVEAGEWARDNTAEHAVYLTGTEHLDPVLSIAGKTIVCGPDLWLYWHGFDTTARKAEVTAFYEDPQSHLDLLTKYDVDYIFVSSYERSSYAVNTTALDALFERVFENSEAVIYKVAEG